MGIQGVSGQELRALEPGSQVRTPASQDAQTVREPASAAGAKGAPDSGGVKAPEARRVAPPQPDGIRFRFDEVTRRVVAQVLDENNQVVKQVPPEEVLKVLQSMRQTMARLFDAEA